MLFIKLCPLPYPKKFRRGSNSALEETLRGSYVHKKHVLYFALKNPQEGNTCNKQQDNLELVGGGFETLDLEQFSFSVWLPTNNPYTWELVPNTGSVPSPCKKILILDVES